MVNDDKNSGFKLLYGWLDPYWCLAMNDLLEEPQGEMFIDGDQYADIALHMVEYMFADSEYVPSAGYPDLVINIALQIISPRQSFYNTSHYCRDLSKYPS